MSKTFYGIDLPSDWHIFSDLSSGLLDLQEGAFTYRGLTAEEVRRRLIQFHKMEAINEQHRQSNQAPRNPPAAQSAAGNTGGAQAHQRAVAQKNATGGVPGPQLTFANTSAGAGGISFASAIYSAAAFAAHQKVVAAQAAQMRQHQAKLMQQAMMYGTALGVWPEPLPRSAPALGELIGHRAWTVKGRNLLCSISADTAWFPGQPMHDKVGHGQKISDHGTAGIWAFKDPYMLANEFYTHVTTKGVFGTVWLWGTVIEHEHGYRAQYAAIRSLDHAAPHVDLEILRAAYLPKRDAP
jgi:hypothetical protein